MVTQRLLGLALIGTEWVIYLLLFLSVVSLAVIIERGLFLRAKRRAAVRLRRIFASVAKKNDRSTWDETLKNDESVAAQVAIAAIEGIKNGGMDAEDSLGVALSEAKVRLERRTVILATLGSNAPYLGLFGTVLGIMRAFHNLAVDVKGGPGVVMSGISEALVATALGLFVAIPAVAAYNYFVRRIKVIIVDAENFAHFAVTHYFGAKR